MKSLNKGDKVDKVDEAIKKFTGMKTFLKAMGIIIENKNSWKTF